MGRDYTKNPYVEYEEYGKKSAEELIANLAAEVARLSRKIERIELSERRLEEEVDTNTKDIRRMGEELAETDYKAGQALTTIEKNELETYQETLQLIIDDIVMLDERTRQPSISDDIRRSYE